MQVITTLAVIVLTGRLEGSTTNEEAVNIRLLAELAAVLLVDTSTVEDSGLVGNLVADRLEPVTDSLVDLLGLLGGGDLASANGPDGLVGNDNLGPVADLSLESLKLLADNLNGLASLTLLEALTAAPDNTDAVLGGVLGLGGNNIVRLAEDGAALRVAENGPVDVGISKLADGELAGESTVGLVVDILGGDLDFLAEGLAGRDEVKGGRGDDNLCWIGS